MAWMPGASRVQTFSGNRYTAPIDKVVVHTTEGSSWPGYNGGGYAPHVTLKRTGSIRQHIDTAHSAKALENDRGGVQTNNDGALQVECIGSCDRAYARRYGLFYWPDATDADLAPLAEFLAWAHTEHGVPLTTRGLEFTSNGAYGESAAQRMSYAQWRDFSGVCGHQHVPENAHWDPGEMPVERAVVLARRIVNAGNFPVGGGASVPRPSAPAQPWESSPRVQGMSKAEVKRVQQALADRGYDLGKWGVDGKYGEATYNAVRAAQKALGVTVDGIAGPDTMNALTGAQKPAQKPSGPNLDVDGRFGHASVRALQEWLNEEHGAGLVVDGKAGHSTWTALQHALGTPADGKVSNQSYKASELGNGITQGWDYDGRGASGSTMVRALQERVGVTPDGIWYQGTTRAVQQALNDGSL